MRILFDQGTPDPLRALLTRHSVTTAYEKGWSRLENGELLDAAEREGFELLITTDSNIKHQQNLEGRRIGIVVLLSTSWPLLPLGLLALPAGAQDAYGFSGIWVADPADQNFDIYGEVRLVHEEDDAIEMAMLDFGVGWQEDASAYVGRLAIMPWTFRFGQWGPRRGPDDSKAPQARARWSGEDLVLAKRTVSGNGEFVWLWSFEEGGSELVHLETRRSWDADFAERPSGTEFRFRRATGEDPALSLFNREGGLVAGRPKVRSVFDVRVSEDQTEMLVSCPEHDCRVADFECGQEIRSRALPMAEVTRVPFGVEVHIWAVR